MKDFGFSVSAPVSLAVIFCGLAILLGSDPWVVARAVAVCIPVIAYVTFAIFTVIWAIKIGEIGVRQEATLQAKFFFWHGVSVILTIVLAASGSFVVLFASLIGGLLGGNAR